MGGAAGVQPARVRHWGPIEIVWTIAVVLAMTFIAMNAIAFAMAVADEARDDVPESAVGLERAWRAFQLGSLQTEVPGSVEPFGRFGRFSPPLEQTRAWEVAAPSDRIAFARFAAPPADGPAALYYAQKLADAPYPTELPNPPAVTDLGFVYESMSGDGRTIWRAIVREDATYVVVAQGPRAVQDWYPRIIDRLAESS